MTEPSGQPVARVGLFVAFASLGVTAAFVPAILPVAERTIGENLSNAVPVLFFGLLLGVLLVGPLRRMLRLRTTIMAGSALQAVAVIAAGLSTRPATFLAAAAVAGVGFGLVEAAGSIAAKHATTGSATGLLSALTGTVACCAAVTPLVVAATSAEPRASCALAAIPAAAVFLVRDVGAPQSAPVISTRAVSSLWLVLPYALALPLYVGVETMLSGWSAIIPERALSLEPGVAALGTSAFWTLMALGRFGAAALRRRGLGPGAILAVGSIAATAGLTCGAAFIREQPVWALVSTAVAVTALAPTYGLILGLALDHLDAARGHAVTGVLVACGSLGGALVPAAILLTARDPASVFTYAASAALCALIPVLAGWGRRRGTRVSAAR
ncbi:hypothetical protein LG322_14105 [Microbacterium aerolatum]|uniref:MFS transporter n=1 Tax=Microbacterium aerolatum TaxID=153731 RepID=UPI00384B299E